MSLLASNATAIRCNTTIYGYPISSESEVFCVYLYLRLFLTCLSIGMAGLHLLMILMCARIHCYSPDDDNKRDLRKHARRFGIYLALAAFVELGALYGALYLCCACWGWLARHARCCRRSDRVLDDFQKGALESGSVVCDGEVGNRVDEFVLEIGTDDETPEEWVGSMVDTIVRNIIEAFDDGHECSICFEPMEPETLLRTTPCSHTFHAVCLNRWFATAGSARLCPLCKQDCSEGGAARV